MIEHALPQALEVKAKAILEQSKTQKLNGKITSFTRKGARQIQYVMLVAGVITLNGQPIRMTYDKIAATHITAIGKKIVVTFRYGKSGIIFREPLDPALSFCELAVLAEEMIRQYRA